MYTIIGLFRCSTRRFCSFLHCTNSDILSRCTEGTYDKQSFDVSLRMVRGHTPWSSVNYNVPQNGSSAELKAAFPVTMIGNLMLYKFVHSPLAGICFKYVPCRKINIIAWLIAHYVAGYSPSSQYQALASCSIHARWYITASPARVFSVLGALWRSEILIVIQLSLE